MHLLKAALALCVLALPQEEVKDREIPDALQAGATHLLEKQKQDGSWGGDSAFSNDRYIRMAVTSIAIRALRAAKHSIPSLEIGDAVNKGLEFVRANSGKRPEKPFQGLYDFSIYACIYSAELLARESDDASKEALEKCLKLIDRNQTANGGFSYVHEGADFRKERDGEGENPLYESFVTALVLDTLWETKQAGHQISEATYNRAFEALATTRTPEEYFCYHMVDGEMRGSISGNGKLSWPGSIARSIMCEYVMYKIGQGRKEALEKALESFFEHREELEKVRKKDNRGTHQGKYDCAPYYYLFGHYYATLAALKLGGEMQEKYIPVLRELLLKIRESDGTWLDSRIGGRQYSCATSMLILSRIAHPGKVF